MLMNKTKHRIVVFSNGKEKNVQEGAEMDNGLGFLKSRERKCAFSLDFQPFRPSILYGARSKAVLRGEGSRGDLFGGVPTTPRGRDLFILALFFG